ncbi:alanine/glycine:cation symporter family protein [Utexia brackfieldae]|uniref:alanine/glycine:cation symporter family protein n=1 Tax=Utexia brackfieldae TaxID=3074108 RepID=UPI00370D045D
MSSWKEGLTIIVDILNTHLSYVLIAVLLVAGIYFTIRLGFIQIRHFGHMFGVLHNSRQLEGEGISSYQAFCTSMAARVGTGNVAGIAIAITLGGPGAIFWMWLIAILSAATSFAESTLAQLFKQRDDRGQFRGGPAYYMERGLNARWLGILFSIFLIVCYGFAFNAVQANTITESMSSILHMPAWGSGVFVTFFSFLVIFGGLRRIAKVSEYVVPPMAGLYILAALIIVVANYSRIPDVFGLIFRSAFGLQEFAAGGFGAAVMNGIKRGLFSNEAGLGSAPNIAASATPYPPHPASQGYVQMAGVVIDTVVICTASAAIVLLSGVPLDSTSGIVLVEHALSTQYGDWSKYILLLIILFFAFTSIIANYTYAENCFLFLRKEKTAKLYGFRVMVCFVVFLGAVASLPLVWAMADIAMALMAMTNLVAVLLLSRLVTKLAKDYNQQRAEKKLPTFDLNQYPEVKDKVAKGVWE